MPQAPEDDRSEFESSILEEFDVGFNAEYQVAGDMRTNSCKRVSYCSCDCDRCAYPPFA